MERTSTVAQSAIETTSESLSLLRKTNCKGPTSKSTGTTKTAAATTATKSSSVNVKGRVSRKESILCNKDKFTDSESANNSSTEHQQLLAAAQQQQQQSSAAQQQCPKRAPKPRRRVATMAQRRAANIRERRRMFNLNSAFDRLRKKVPSFAYEKRLSRIETLKLAIMYIRFMDDLVKDDAYAEKYKQLTANYGVGGSAAGGPLGVASSGGFLTTSSYLSLYGCVDSASPSPDRLQHNSHQHQHQTTVVQSSQIGVASQQVKQQQQQFVAANTTSSCSTNEDGEQSPPAGQRLHPGNSAGGERVQLCTDVGCAGSIVAAAAVAAAAAQLPQHYRVGRPSAGLARNSSASLILKASPTVPPSSMACCSSPALSSSTTCNSSNFNSDSPDLSPQVHQQQQQQQQQPARPLICPPSMDYYQQPYDSYPLDQTSFYGGGGEPAASQPSGHASKMFYYGGSAGAGLNEDTNHRGHQGQRAHDYCTAGGGGGAQLVAEPVSARHAMAEPHAAGQLGYTLHSLQAR